MQRMKIVTGLLFLAVYSMILIHDFIPHHSHDGEDYIIIHNHSHSHSHDEDGNHSDCDHPHECDFPFHQHNINEAGFFMSPSMIMLGNPILTEITLQELQIEEENTINVSERYTDYQSLKYLEPEISATSLRGPPIA